MQGVDDADELVQIVERALADAEELFRQAPTEANQRRVMSVRKAREAAQRDHPARRFDGQRL
jgi:hypothetical protein